MKMIIKKYISFVLGIILFLGVIAVLDKEGQVVKGSDEALVQEISEKLIRFHVLANSDSEEDQALKMKVKDEVISFIAPKLENSSSIEESREILKENNDEIIEIATKCIKDNGYNYSVSTTLGKENFPTKVYGNITLPQGEYEAFRVLIGDADGANWWCVMFPPLCFVDVTKGQISYDETDERMKKVLDEDEFNAVSTSDKVNDDKTEVTLKLKIFDLFNK